MTRERDIDRLLDAWFADGPMQVSDRAFDEVVGRVHRQRQRPAWRFLWRKLHVTTPFKVALGAAAIIVVFVAGFAVFGRPGSQAGGVAAPTASTVPTPSPTSTAPPAGLHGGSLVGGRYRLMPFDAAPSLTIDVDVPAGWQGFPKWALIGPNGTEAPGGTGIGFLMPAGVFSDPCHWDVAGDGSWPQHGDVPGGRTVDDLVAALAGNSHYVAGAATDAVVGGYPAKRLDLQLPAEMAPTDVGFASTCDALSGGPGGGTVFVWGTAEADGSDLYVQGPGARWHVWIVDADGTRLVVVVDDFATTSAADQAAARAIVDSMVITP